MRLYIHFLVCSLGYLLNAQAQNAPCLNFDGLRPETTFGRSTNLEPGAVFHTESKVILSLEEFLYSNGEEDFWDVTVFGPDPVLSWPGTMANSLFISNINVNFDFRSLPEPVTGVCLDIWDGGGEENLAVNDRPVQVWDFAQQMPEGEIAPGITAQFTPFPEGESWLPSGTLCLTGNIETLTIGGQEFLVDNVCFSGAPSPTQGCLPVEEFSERIYSEETGFGPGDLAFESEAFTVELIEMLDFDWFTRFGALRVQSSGDDNVLPQASSDFLTFDEMAAVIDLRNYPGEVRSIELDFAIGEGPVNLGTNGEPVMVLEGLAPGFFAVSPGITAEVISLTGVPGAGRLIISGPVKTLLLGGIQMHIDNICVNPSPDCSIGNVSAEVTNCDEEGNYFVFINFAHQNTAGGFSIWMNGNETGQTFGYEELPVRLGPYPAPLERELTIQVRDLENPDCAGEAIFGPVTCEQTCSIRDAVITDIGCSGTGSYRTTLNFLHDHTGETFLLETKGGFRKVYRYEQLPIALEELPAPEDGVDVLEICDEGAPNCCTRLEYRVECETVCEIWDLAAEPLPCNDDGTYEIELDFQHVRTAETFSVELNDEAAGTFTYEELPLRFGPFDSATDEVLVFKVKDASEACYDFVEAVAPNCEPDRCRIEQVRAEAAECDEDGYFLVEVSFAVSNPNFIGYYIFADGEINGPFDYTENNTQVLGPFKGDGSTTYDFLILDIAEPSCFGYTEVVSPDCRKRDCLIEVEIFEAHPCEDGTFLADLVVRNLDPNAEGFKVSAVDGQQFGPFSYRESFITIGPFRSAENDDKLRLRFEDLEVPDCVLEEKFEAPNCNREICTITDLEVETGSCNADGTYRLKIDFDPGDHSTGRFDLFVRDGEAFGNYAVTELPLIIENFSPSGKEYDFLKLCLSGIENCCEEIEFKPPLCEEEGECKITDLSVRIGQCNPDGTYQLTIDFEIADSPNDFFDLFVRNNELLGFYKIGDLPVTINNFRPSGRPEDFLKVCINDTRDCCQAVEFIPPDCETDECFLEVVVVETHSCQDGSYMVDIELDARNGSDAGFTVFGPDQENLGSYSYTEPFITLGPFAGDGQSAYPLEIIDNENQSCGTSTVLHPAICTENGCRISDPEIEPGDCGRGNLYDLVLDFRFEEPGNSLFEVFTTAGLPLGIFELSDLPVKLENFPSSGEFQDTLMVCINDSPECCLNIAWQTPDCLVNSCGLTVDSIEPSSCEGEEIFLTLHNVATNRIEFEGDPYYLVEAIIEGESQQFGPFLYSQANSAPIGPFPGDGLSSYDLIVVEGNQDGCRLKVSYGPIDCLDNEVWPGDANADNVAQHFDLLNIGLAFGQEGPARANPGTEWNASSSDNWEETFSDGVNFKHADCNGDGRIDRSDREAIIRNFGRTHGEVEPAEELDNTLLGPPIFVDFSEIANLPPNTEFEIPIVLGTEEDPVNDIYGVAFTLAFDPSVITAASIEIEYPVTWFGDPEVNVLTLDRTDLAGGTVDIAITRTDQNNVSGYGPIAYMRGIIDDIAGLKSSELEIEKTKALGKHGEDIPLNGLSQEFEILPDGHNIGRQDLLRQLRVFPNPTHDRVTIANSFAMALNRVTLLKPDGAILRQLPLNGNAIELGSVPDGVYILRIEIGEYTIHKRIVRTSGF